MSDSLLRAQVPSELDTIKGWFNPSDRRMFAWLLQRQLDSGVRGNVVELGSYLGKSAVFIGDFVHPDETFTVLDLFESEAGDADNKTEWSGSYSTLTEDAFKKNWLSFHPQLPVVVKATSDHIVEHVEPGSVRFMHIDASHLYEHVAVDVESAKLLLQPDGIVAFDDYRSEHCPGVAAAAWEAVNDKGLHLLCVTESKLYGTWGDPKPWIDAMQQWLEADPDAYLDWHRIHGERSIRCKIKLPSTPAPAATSTKAASTAAASPAGAAPAARSGRSRSRRLAKDWLPPAVHRAVSKRLNPR